MAQIKNNFSFTSLFFEFDVEKFFQMMKNFILPFFWKSKNDVFQADWSTLQGKHCFWLFFRLFQFTLFLTFFENFWIKNCVEIFFYTFFQHGCWKLVSNGRNFHPTIFWEMLISIFEILVLYFTLVVKICRLFCSNIFSNTFFTSKVK